MTVPEIRDRLHGVAATKRYRTIDDVAQIDVGSFRLIVVTSDVTSEMLRAIDDRAIMNTLPPGQFTTPATRKRLPLLPIKFKNLEI